MANLSSEIMRHLDEIWYEYVTGEPLPETNGKADQVRTILWQAAQAAYVAVLGELGFQRDLKLENAWREPDLNDAEIGRRQQQLVNEYIERLEDLPESERGSTPMLARQQRGIEIVRELPLATILNHVGFTVAGVGRSGSGPHHGLIVKQRYGCLWYASILRQFPMWEETFDLGQQAFLHRSVAGGSDPSSFFVELPIAEWAINELLLKIWIAEGFSNRIKTLCQIIEGVLCPAMMRARDNSLVMKLDAEWNHSMEERKIIYRIFRREISCKDWLKARELDPALRQSVIQNAAAIRDAVYSGKNLPPNLPAEVVELIRTYREKLLAAGPSAWLKLPQDLQQPLMDAYLAGNEH